MVEENGEQKNTAASSEGETVSANGKKKKIARMNAVELESTIKSVQDKMGNLSSHYGQQLLKRKDVLSA